jgi:hypothetical protein
MQSTARTAPVSSTRRLAGRIIAGLAVLFLLFDSVTKLLRVRPVLDAFTQLGYPDSLARGIGALLLVSLLLYVIPRTSVLGAIVLTGFLGGAVASHLRIGDPLVSHVLFPTYVGALLWGGLYLRDDRLRQFVPLRR